MDPSQRDQGEPRMPPIDRSDSQPEQGSWLPVALAWIAVGIPLGWGVFMTFKKAALLFQ